MEAVDDECAELVEAEARRAVANALVALAAARFHPHVRIEEMAKVVGLEVTDVQAAVRRWREAMIRPARPRLARAPVTDEPRRPPARSRRSRPEPPGPPPRRGLVWCSWADAPHWTPRANMGRNKARKDGFSDWCLDHWREYHRERAEAGKVNRAPGSGGTSNAAQSVTSVRTGEVYDDELPRHDPGGLAFGRRPPDR